MNQPAEHQPISLIKSLLFMACLLPLARLVWAFYTNDLGDEPTEFVQRWTGTWTFNLLILTLCVSPLRAVTQWHWLLRLRRMLGLFTFLYATLHLLAFIGFDNGFVLDDIARDVMKRPYVTVGLAAFILLIPLAATSNQYALRKLGGRKWQELHRNIYLISILAAAHYFWLSKLDEWMWPITYAIVLGWLLRWRIQERRRKAMPVQKTQTAKPIKFFSKKPD